MSTTITNSTSRSTISDSIEYKHSYTKLRKDYLFSDFENLWKKSSMVLPATKWKVCEVFGRILGNTFISLDEFYRWPPLAILWVTKLVTGSGLITKLTS